MQEKCLVNDATVIYIYILLIIQEVVLILTGLNSALCCDKQSKLYRDRQKERLHFLLF